MSLWLSGIGVSRGIAIGRVQKLHGGDLEIPEYTIAAEELDREIDRFTRAQAEAREQLRQVRARIPLGTPGDIAAFIDTHILMLDDRSLTEATVAHIRGHKLNAEAALRRSRDALVAVFDQMEDPYLRTRRDDVEHVVSRIQRVLVPSSQKVDPPPEVPLSEPTVIVADDITPADIILLSQQGVVAFVTEYGGPLSHTAILARSLGIPAVVGLHNARRLLREAEPVIVDGEHGHVLADPDEMAFAHFRKKQARQLKDRRSLRLLRDKRAVSADGVEVHLLANVELPEDAREAAANGAEGVGLYRTEFLFMNRKDTPSEDEQFEAYAKVVEAVQGEAMAGHVDLGAMIEVPAAAISAPLLARHCRFFSIGTNDLIQYTLAIDRVDDEVNYLYDPLHPAVLRLIRMTIDAGHRAGIPVAMCGEMAGDVRFTRLLLGLGLREFSMQPATLLEVKRAVREADVAQLRMQVDQVLDAADSAAFERALDAFRT